MGQTQAGRSITVAVLHPRLESLRHGRRDTPSYQNLQNKWMSTGKAIWSHLCLILNGTKTTREKEKAHFYKQRRLFPNIVDELQLGKSLENDGKGINMRI